MRFVKWYPPNVSPDSGIGRTLSLVFQRAEKLYLLTDSANGQEVPILI
jgi:hypothetical protein